MTILVIVESPAKCKKIESILGVGYKVVASYGHIRVLNGLASLNIMDSFNATFALDPNPFKAEKIEQLRASIAAASGVVIATDNDREGEAIGWHICDTFSLSVARTKRIVFNEISETAIKRAMASPGIIDTRLVDAQKTRQFMDLMVGFRLSPELWRHFTKQHSKSLSAGRVQSPALRLVYDNYVDIQASPGKMVYSIVGYFTDLNLAFDLSTQFATSSGVVAFLERCKTHLFAYSCSEPKRSFRQPPEPLTTSTLQQIASNELRLSPKETMKHAQSLYEAGLITYMRTDAKRYSVEFIQSVKEFTTSEYGKPYVRQNIDTLSTTQQQQVATQDAHEAIRPVSIQRRECGSDLDRHAVKLYALIWARTLESCMSSAQFSVIGAAFSSPEPDTEFRHKSEEVVFPGWTAVRGGGTEKGAYQYLLTLKDGQTMQPKKVASAFKLINAKQHYSEARLVQLLEERGIGRPSTFASIIEKIQERKYVEKKNIDGVVIEDVIATLVDGHISETPTTQTMGSEKAKLVISPLGVLIIEYLVKHFAMFLDYDYTKTLEDKLDAIAQGHEQLLGVCNECNTQLTALLAHTAPQTKFELRLDGEHVVIVGKFGLVIKRTIKDKDKDITTFIPVKKGLDIAALNQMKTPCLADIMEAQSQSPSRVLGKYKAEDLHLKSGKYGKYVQWGGERVSLKGDFVDLDIDKIEYTDVLRYLERDALNDVKKPVGVVRQLDKNTSIRAGKYGDYIFYKPPRTKDPVFYKLAKFGDNYKTCESAVLLKWINDTYKPNDEAKAKKCKTNK